MGRDREWGRKRTEWLVLPVPLISQILTGPDMEGRC